MNVRIDEYFSYNYLHQGSIIFLTVCLLAGLHKYYWLNFMEKSKWISPSLDPI